MCMWGLGDLVVIGMELHFFLNVTRNWSSSVRNVVEPSRGYCRRLHMKAWCLFSFFIWCRRAYVFRQPFLCDMNGNVAFLFLAFFKLDKEPTSNIEHACCALYVVDDDCAFSSITCVHICRHSTQMWGWFPQRRVIMMRQTVEIVMLLFHSLFSINTMHATAKTLWISVEKTGKCYSKQSWSQYPTIQKESIPKVSFFPLSLSFSPLTCR